MKFLEIWAGFLAVMAIILTGVYISVIYGSFIGTVMVALLLGSLVCLAIAFAIVEDEKEEK